MWDQICPCNIILQTYITQKIRKGIWNQPGSINLCRSSSGKILANQFPEKDFENVKVAFQNMKKINAQQLVLISTIDVYPLPDNVYEDTEMVTKNLDPYGLNRLYLEQWVEQEFENALIVRLPGLYGKNLKKNFIYDMIHMIPKMLNETKYKELSRKDAKITEYYSLQENGFYKCRELEEKEEIYLKDCFDRIHFSALDFTDSRGNYQFYNLEFLWEHISIALSDGINKLNISTEPVSIGGNLYIYNEKGL